eukprot:evm.model.scf_562.3 EVM.evm.TU.scf_562.3   scf_562:50296-53381(-)
MGKVIPDSTVSGSPDDKLVLHGVGPMGNTASSVSPFVTKVELFLRIMGLDYEADVNFGGPKGKIPWITHGEVVLGDSTFIIEYLKNTYKSSVKMKEPETPMQKAINTSVLHICEDNLVYGINYYRVLKPEGFALVRTFMQGLMPIPFRWFMPYVLRRSERHHLYEQGLTRHSEHDIETILTSSLAALSTFLGDQTNFFGADPCETDCIAFGFLDQYLHEGTTTSAPTLVKQFPNLVRFVDNVRSQYFSEDHPSKFVGRKP